MKLPLINITRFLRKAGWTAVEHPNPKISLFESPKNADGDFTTVLLPRDIELADASRRIGEAIQEIADFTGESVPRISDQIILWDRDILRTRVFDRHKDINALKLPLALTIIEELKSFLGYTAYTQQDPRPYFSKAGATAAEFTDQCLFGHTFPGSFGFRVECPLPRIGQLAITDDLKEAPFERQVFQRIAVGYQTISTATATQNPQLLIDGYKEGFGANSLNTLKNIFESLDGALSVEYAIDWSPELAPIVQLSQPAMLNFDARTYDVVRYAARELEKDAAVDETTVVSYIKSLTSEKPLADEAQDSFEHVITIEWERMQGFFVKIRVSLPAQEYKLACDAHRDGRKISIQGIPEKDGKFWSLKFPRNIRFHV